MSSPIGSEVMMEGREEGESGSCALESTLTLGPSSPMTLHDTASKTLDFWTTSSICDRRKSRIVQKEESS